MVDFSDRLLGFALGFSNPAKLAQVRQNNRLADLEAERIEQNRRLSDMRMQDLQAERQRKMRLQEMQQQQFNYLRELAPQIAARTGMGDQGLQALRQAPTQSAFETAMQFFTPQPVNRDIREIDGALLEVTPEGVQELYRAMPEQDERKIIEQDGIQYFADSGEPVIAKPLIDPVATAAKKAKEYKQGELTSAGFASRMTGAEDIIDRFENNEEFDPINELSNTLGTFAQAAGNIALSPEQRQYKQAARNWIQAKLRKESGAAIPPEEMESEYRTFFPVVGDDPQTIKQKREARDIATKAMIIQSQGAYDDLFTNKQESKDTAETNTDLSQMSTEELLRIVNGQ